MAEIDKIQQKVGTSTTTNSIDKISSEKSSTPGIAQTLFGAGCVTNMIASSPRYQQTNMLRHQLFNTGWNWGWGFGMGLCPINAGPTGSQIAASMGLFGGMPVGSGVGTGSSTGSFGSLGPWSPTTGFGSSAGSTDVIDYFKKLDDKKLKALQEKEKAIIAATTSEEISKAHKDYEKAEETIFDTSLSRKFDRQYEFYRFIDANELKEINSMGGEIKSINSNIKGVEQQIVEKNNTIQRMIQESAQKGVQMDFSSIEKEIQNLQTKLNDLREEASRKAEIFNEYVKKASASTFSEKVHDPAAIKAKDDKKKKEALINAMFEPTTGAAKTGNKEDITNAIKSMNLGEQYTQENYTAVAEILASHGKENKAKFEEYLKSAEFFEKIKDSIQFGIDENGLKNMSLLMQVYDKFLNEKGAYNKQVEQLPDIYNEKAGLKADIKNKMEYVVEKENQKTAKAKKQAVEKEAEEKKLADFMSAIKNNDADAIKNMSSEDVDNLVKNHGDQINPIITDGKHEEVAQIIKDKQVEAAKKLGNNNVDQLGKGKLAVNKGQNEEDKEKEDKEKFITAIKANNKTDIEQMEPILVAKLVAKYYDEVESAITKAECWYKPSTWFNRDEAAGAIALKLNEAANAYDVKEVLHFNENGRNCIELKKKTEENADNLKYYAVEDVGNTFAAALGSWGYPDYHLMRSLAKDIVKAKK